MKVLRIIGLVLLLIGLIMWANSVSIETESSENLWIWIFVMSVGIFTLLSCAVIFYLRKRKNVTQISKPTSNLSKIGVRIIMWSFALPFIIGVIAPLLYGTADFEFSFLVFGLPVLVMGLIVGIIVLIIAQFIRSDK